MNQYKPVPYFTGCGSAFAILFCAFLISAFVPNLACLFVGAGMVLAALSLVIDRQEARR